MKPQPHGADGTPECVDWSPAPSGSQRRLAAFLHTLDLDASEVRSHANAMSRLRSGELQAVVLHGVYPEALMSATVERLQRHDPPFLKTWFPEAFHAWFYGRNINLADADLPGYFDESATFNAQLTALMPPCLDLATRIGGLLSALDHGRPFVAAPGPQPGQRYMFSTLRAHVEQGYIPAHFDNEMRLRPSYRHLAGLVDECILSFVLGFSTADSGGALEVFNLQCAAQDARLLSDDRVRDKPALARLASVRFRLPPGSLILLDSGRYLHRVTRVCGPRTRWTACSFMATSRDGAALFCWG